MFRKLKVPSYAIAALACVQSISMAHAEIVFLPGSTHQLFQTYGLFMDQQSSLLYQNGGRAWASVGGTLAILGAPEWKWSPQLIVHGSANAAFRIDSANQTLLTETNDARAGLAADFHLNAVSRLSLTWTHQSGHISDNVPDPELIGPNLGNEILSLRFIHDIDRSWRIGAALNPIVGSDPAMKAFGAEQFAEWYPWGATQDPHGLSPYLAAGCEQFGLNQIDLTCNFQAGVVGGNHLIAEHHSSLRAVIGYYTGADPRLKYYQFKNLKAQFGYLGLMLDF